MRSLVILGAGGHGRVCAAIAQQTGKFETIVFSDNQFKKGSMSGSWVVRFHDADLSATEPAQYEFILGIGQTGSGQSRQRVFTHIIEKGLSAVTVVSPDAHVASDVVVGKGTLIGRTAILNPGASVGDNVIINTRALVEHDSQIGGHVHVSTGAIVNGGCVVGDRSLIGSGATLLNGIRVGSDIIIGAGAVVTKHIDEPGTYAGVPARRLHD